MKLTTVEVFTPRKLKNATIQGAFFVVVAVVVFEVEPAYQYTTALSSLLNYKIIKTKLLPLGIIWGIQTSTKSLILPSNPSERDPALNQPW